MTTLQMMTVSLLTSTLLFAETSTESGTDLNKMNMEQMNKFFYEMGFKDAAEENYSRGYRDALAYAESRLKEYGDKIRSIEYGKYLTSTGKVSAPELYQEYDKSTGGQKVKYIGCKIVKPLTPHEIISLPTLMAPTINRGAEKVSYSNGVDVASRDRNDPNGIATVPERDKSIHYHYIENTRYNRNKLSQMNYRYTIKGSDQIKVLFTSKEEMSKFKTQFVD